MKKEKFFKLFLVIYVGFLVFHSFSLSWDSLIVPISVCAGFGVAILAHTRYGVLTIGLLLIHMGLEWVEYAQHGWHFSKGEMVLHGVHVCLDFIFLHQEFRMHLKKFRALSFSGVIAGLAIIFVSNYQSPPHNHYTRVLHQRLHIHHHKNNSPVEAFVIGGMFGCILYHLTKRKAFP